VPPPSSDVFDVIPSYSILKMQKERIKSFTAERLRVKGAKLVTFKTNLLPRREIKYFAEIE